MRIAVTGTTGRVGAALVNHLGAEHQVIALPRQVCDLAEASSLAAALERLECEVLINPAAVTSVDACEGNPDLAMRVNAAAPAEMAAWAARRGVRLVHFSSDYVFEGKSPGLRREDDPALPVNVYGASKLSGEQAVLAYPGHLVIRTSWVFGPEKPSFVDQIRDAALAGKPLAAVADKYSLPTATSDLAEWTRGLIEKDASGIVHACNPGEPVSWHGMAVAVVDELAAQGLLETRPVVAAQSWRDLTMFRAARPCFTAMDTAKLAGLLDRPLRPWREAVADWVGTFHCGETPG